MAEFEALKTGRRLADSALDALAVVIKGVPKPKMPARNSPGETQSHGIRWCTCKEAARSQRLRVPKGPRSTQGEALTRTPLGQCTAKNASSGGVCGRSLRLLPVRDRLADRLDPTPRRRHGRRRSPALLGGGIGCGAEPIIRARHEVLQQPGEVLGYRRNAFGVQHIRVELEQCRVPFRAV